MVITQNWLVVLALALSAPSDTGSRTISEEDARSLVYAAIDTAGYPSNRIWDQIETSQLDECSSVFYCFTMYVDAGEWSPVIANFAVGRRDAAVWELWGCNKVDTPQLRKKQHMLRVKHGLPRDARKPHEFLSDCSTGE